MLASAFSPAPMPRFMLHIVAVFAAGLAAGVMNSVSGGGSILTFPTLLWLGIPGKLASATNSLAVWPGTLTGAWGLRREFPAGAKPMLKKWLIPALAGGALGAWLLRRTPNHWFAQLAPLLVLAATLALALDPVLSLWIPRREGGPKASHILAGGGLVLAVAIYGGYFGAGMGILILSALAVVGLRDLRSGIGVKNLLACAIKSLAIAYYITQGMIVWTAGLGMAAGCALGGWSGAHITRRLPSAWLRGIMLVMGGLIALRLMLARHL